jgi:hypothetical protein
MKKNTWRFFQILMLLSLASAARCYAHFTGGVQGTVQDAKGAVVPKATVTLVNADTSVTQTAISNASGVYRFSNVPYPSNFWLTLHAIINYRLSRIKHCLILPLRSSGK